MSGLAVLEHLHMSTSDTTETDEPPVAALVADNAAASSEATFHSATPPHPEYKLSHFLPINDRFSFVTGACCSQH